MLCLPKTLRENLIAAALRGYPLETCGLLLGKQSDDVRMVIQVRAARNLSPDRAEDRYELDPDDFLAADRDARAAGVDIIGVWHSHPDHPARPSATDREGAWPNWSYVIVAVSGAGATEVRSWRLNGGDFGEEEVSV